MDTKRPDRLLPDYKYVYSFYAYNKRKYRDIFKKVKALAYKYEIGIFDRVNPYDVLKLCYIEKDGALQPLGLLEEKHLYRYKTFYNILKEIALTLLNKYKLFISPDVLKYLYRRTGIVFHIEELQAEMYLREEEITYRLKYHIELLRQLRKRRSIETAVQKTNEKMNGGTPPELRSPDS